MMKEKEPIEIFIVNDTQLASINQGKKEIEAGNYILNEDLDNEIKNKYQDIK